MQDTTELARRIRRHAVEMTHLGKSSHVGSILSMADIIAVLYGKVMRLDPTRPRWANRDRFILSKGHAGAGIYAVLAESGFFPVEKLLTHYQDGSDLSGHVSHKGIPGVEFSTGSLGHGLPVAAGMAKAGQLDGASHRIFVLLSDGECDEGTTWESALIANHFGLNNFCVIIDRNNLQSMGSTESTLALEPFAEKWKAFGWDVIEIDGHNFKELVEALKYFSNKPICIIANTIKGKGVDFMEGSVVWHYRPPTEKDLLEALEQIEGSKS